jgi:hypothetical protein
MTKASEFSALILGCHAEVVLGITPDCFAVEMIRVHIDRECKGKLRKVQQTYTARIIDERQEFGQKVVTVEGATECQ